MTYQDFVDKYLGQTKGYPTDDYYKGQCLSIVKLYIKEYFGIDPPPSGTNSAYGYWSNFPDPLGTKFTKILNYKDTVPEAGWIAIWEPWASNEYGHIAIVAEGSTTGTLKNYAQNWTSKVFQLESNRYTNVVGFLKPIKDSEETMTQDEQRALETLKRYKEEANHGNLEGAANSAIGAAKDMPNVLKELAGLKNSQKDLEARVRELEASLTEIQGSADHWQRQFTTANNKVSKLEAELATVTEDRQTWKNRYEAKLKETADKQSAWELFKLLVSKLWPIKK